MLKEQIENLVSNNINVIEMSLENESHMHSGQAEESHFKLTLVSDDFNNVSKVKRHQTIYKVLSELMPKFHALALHIYTSEEWTQAKVPDSPNCMGGH